MKNKEYKNYFRCYSIAMARYLCEQCGFELLGKQYSQIDDRMVYYFESSPEVWDSAKVYNENYYEHLKSLIVEDEKDTKKEKKVTSTFKYKF